MNISYFFFAFLRSISYICLNNMRMCISIKNRRTNNILCKKNSMQFQVYVCFCERTDQLWIPMTVYTFVTAVQRVHTQALQITDVSNYLVILWISTFLTDFSPKKIKKMLVSFFLLILVLKHLKKLCSEKKKKQKDRKKEFLQTIF